MHLRMVHLQVHCCRCTCCWCTNARASAAGALLQVQRCKCPPAACIVCFGNPTGVASAPVVVQVLALVLVQVLVPAVWKVRCGAHGWERTSYINIKYVSKILVRKNTGILLVNNYYSSESINRCCIVSVLIGTDIDIDI